jgi:hypothetical protein
MLQHAKAQMKNSARARSDRETEALEMRRILKFLKEIDEDGNGTLEWDEFVAFFRKAGYLLEYSEKDNPREKIADLLGQINDQQVEGDDVEDFPDLVDEFQKLTQKHMALQCRRQSRELIAKDEFDWDSPKEIVSNGRRASGSNIPNMSSLASNVEMRNSSAKMPRRMSAPVHSAARSILQPAIVHSAAHSMPDLPDVK